MRQFYETGVKKKKMDFWERKKIVFPFSFFFFEDTIKNYFQRIILVNRESKF